MSDEPEASHYPGMLNPDPTKKDPIHSVVTALPVLMLIIGLSIWYAKDRAQNNGAPILAESKELVGKFDGVSSARSAGGKQFYMWLVQDDARKTLRITPQQYEQYQQRQTNTAVTVTAAPTVSGSNTLWLVDIEPE